MARKLRVQYPGALYHVMNRGDRREPIFKDDDERVSPGLCRISMRSVLNNRTLWAMRGLVPPGRMPDSTSGEAPATTPLKHIRLSHNHGTSEDHTSGLQSPYDRSLRLLHDTTNH